MIRTLLLAFLLSVCTQLSAKQITPSQAKEKAKTFIGKLFAQTRAETDRQLHLANAETEYYVFNIEHGKGFVIVSGDDRTENILGYATQGDYSPRHVPENMKWWLECYAKQIRMLDKFPATRTASSAAVNRQKIEPLIATRWDQDKPYNLECPKINGADTYTGCVATAIAQILYHHRLPASATASIPAYFTSTHGIRLQKLDATTFDWDKMQLSYAADDNSEGAREVAKLMRYCGQAVKMDYDSQGSGAFVEADRLVKFFHLNPKMKEVERDDYTLVQWEKMVYEELQARRPVLYTGGKLSGAHAFVCDGYDGNGLFHINWGWSGNGDGFFKLGILNPSVQGSGGIAGSDGYTLYQTIVLGFQAEPLEVEPQDTVLAVKEIPDYYGSVVRRPSVQEDFIITGLQCKVYNPSSEMRTYRFAWGLYQGDMLLRVMGEGEIRNLISGYTANLTRAITIGGDIPNGKYRLIPIYKADTKRGWEPCMDSDLRYVEVNIEDLALKMKVHHEDPNRLKVNKIEPQGRLSVNLPVEIKVDISNEGKVNNPELCLFVDNLLVSAVASNVDPQTSGTVSLHFVPQTPGTYQIRICSDRAGRKVLGKTQVDIADARKAWLTMNTFVPDADPLTHTLAGPVFRCRTSIVNRGAEEYDGNVVCTLYLVEGNYGRALKSAETTLVLQAGETAAREFEFTGLQAGRQYFAGYSYVSGNKMADAEDTGIYTVPLTNGIFHAGMQEQSLVPIYDMKGRKVGETKVSDIFSVLQAYPHGIYIIGGRKYKR